MNLVQNTELTAILLLITIVSTVIRAITNFISLYTLSVATCKVASLSGGAVTCKEFVTKSFPTIRYIQIMNPYDNLNTVQTVT